MLARNRRRGVRADGGGRVKYTRLKQSVDFHKSTEDFDDEQFEDGTPIKPPVKPIAVALFLFAAGSAMIVLAGVIGEGVSGRATPLLVLGIICFVPGVYHVRVAYYAWRGNYGYSYADIPGYDD